MFYFDICCFIWLLCTTQNSFCEIGNCADNNRTTKVKTTVLPTLEEQAIVYTHILGIMRQTAYKFNKVISINREWISCPLALMLLPSWVMKCLQGNNQESTMDSTNYSTSPMLSFTLTVNKKRFIWQTCREAWTPVGYHNVFLRYENPHLNSRFSVVTVDIWTSILSL